MRATRGFILKAQAITMIIVPCLFLACNSFSKYHERTIAYQRPWGPLLWPSKVPPDCPLPPSSELVGVLFTGKSANYSGADTWYPSWGEDGRLYSAYTDGYVGKQKSISFNRGEAVTGRAIIAGDHPQNLSLKVLDPVPGPATPYKGRYPCANLFHNGVWYHGTYVLDDLNSADADQYNYGILGPLIGFDISNNQGQTWALCPQTPPANLFNESHSDEGGVKMGAPHFVDFGQNMQHSPDGKAYLIAHGSSLPDSKARIANNNWINGDQIYLARTLPKPETINDHKHWEFFCGFNHQGEAQWSPDITKIEALIDWNNHCGCVTMTYHPVLEKYIVCVTDGYPSTGQMDTYFLESDTITGPFKIISYLENFGSQAYFVNIPSKFIGRDGKQWLCYSANFNRETLVNPPGSYYALTLQEIQFLSPQDLSVFQKQSEHREKELLQQQQNWDTENPITKKNNIAKQAQITASSTQSSSSLLNMVDGVVGQEVANLSTSWVSRKLNKKRNKKHWVNFQWSEQQKINRILVFDHPHPNVRIMSLKLEFDDGRSFTTGPLPDHPNEGLEITFPVITTRNLKISVEEALKKHVGFAEIALFSDQRGSVPKLPISEGRVSEVPMAD